MPRPILTTVLVVAAVVAPTVAAIAGSFGHVGYGDAFVMHRSAGKEDTAQKRAAGGASGYDLTPAQAIATAEQSAKGHATRLQRAGDDRSSVYRITVIASGVPQSVSIDASSGQIIRTEEVGRIERLLDWEGMTRTDSRATKTTLAAAVSTGEKVTGGSVVEAWLDNDSRIPAYEIETVMNGRTAKVHVNADSGAAAFDFESAE